MNPPTKPGQRCRIIGGRMAYNGEGVGPNRGKEVFTVFMHDEKAGVEQENVWHCVSANGDALQTYYGVGTNADCLECWLEVIEPPPPKAKEQTKELEHGA